MENKVFVNNIIPFSNVDGKGNRTAIFLQGCNLNCIYCHNSETINICNNCLECVNECQSTALKIINGKIKFNKALCIDCDKCISVCRYSASPKIQLFTVNDLYNEIKKYQPYIRGITMSGGEPTLYYEFILELFKKVKSSSKLTCYIDTNGFFDIDKLQQLLEFTDKFLFDIKTVSNSKLISNKLSLNTPIDNLEYLLKLDKIEEVRTVIIEESDAIETIVKVKEILSNYKDINYKLIKVHGKGLKEPNRSVIMNRIPTDEYIDELNKIKIKQ